MVEFWVLTYCTPWPVHEYTAVYYRCQERAACDLAALESDGWEASVSKVDVPAY
jgi:hypothetical protein